MQMSEYVQIGTDLLVEPVIMLFVYDLMTTTTTTTENEN